MPRNQMHKETVNVPKNPAPWQPHDEPAEGSRDIEESNRQASRSQPARYSDVAVDHSPEIEPSDSGPEYFGRQ